MTEAFESSEVAKEIVAEIQLRAEDAGTTVTKMLQKAIETQKWYKDAPESPATEE